MGISIIGTGHYVPGRPYTNFDLARLMDTTDEWVVQRTGIVQRHYCPEGMGASDLALPAAQRALAAAGRKPSDVDYIIFNTMTPDHFFPGSGALLGAKLGCPGAPALDVRQQCAAQIFSLQVARGLLESGAAKCVLIAAAEAHAGFMPWSGSDWDILEGTTDRKPSVEDWDRATRHRGFAVIFGDGGGAFVVERSEDPKTDILSIDLKTDGRYVDQLVFPIGFRTRPFVSDQVLAKEMHLPTMAGKDVFKHAVTKLPASILSACERANVSLGDIDWFIAHQANARINEAVRDRLKIDPAKVPSNIERYGNTSTATIPILMDEMVQDGRLKKGQLLCVFALGAGLHWGSMILRY
jgi:3-oxoacyl-[acyl-carrier-protein] synthase III